jgi:hypothetical protein
MLDILAGSRGCEKYLLAGQLIKACVTDKTRERRERKRRERKSSRLVLCLGFRLN